MEANIGQMMMHRLKSSIIIYILDKNKRGYRVKQIDKNGTRKERNGIVRFICKAEMICYAPIDFSSVITE